LHIKLRQPRLKSGAWERLRSVHMEKTGSNRSNMGEEGSRAESNHGQSGKQKRSKPKSQSGEGQLSLFVKHGAQLISS